MSESDAIDLIKQAANGLVTEQRAHRSRQFVSARPWESDMQCRTTDGNERCCLTDPHPGKHMGRRYTMEQADIDRFEQHLSTLSVDERRKACPYAL